MKRYCKYCQYDFLDGDIIQVKDNFILFNTDELIEYIYQINDGYIKMVRYLESGDEKIIGILGPGEYVALLAVLQKKDNYLATAISLTPTLLKRITKKEVLNSYNKSPEFRDRCLTCAVSRSNTFQNNLVNSASIDTFERIINTLKALYEKFGYQENNQQVIDLPFSKTVLANIIGIRRETLSRSLKTLQEREIVFFEKNKYILNYVI